MKILASWLREYLPGIPVDDSTLADDLTLRGIAVDGIYLARDNDLFEMDITTNRVDAMNHYGMAREAATIYGLPLPPLDADAAGYEAVRRAVSVADGGAGAVRAVYCAGAARCYDSRIFAGVIAEYFALLGLKQIAMRWTLRTSCCMAMGHPTHAFDLDKIEGGRLLFGWRTRARS